MNYDENYYTLGLAIVTRAVYDLRILNQNHLDTIEMDTGTIYKSEVESFFNSSWCDVLVEPLGLTGTKILGYLNS